MTVLPLRNALCGASILALVSSVGFAQTPTYEMTTDIPPEITTPDVVKTSIGTLNFFDGVPNKETIDTVYDYMDRARAVHAYVSTVPGVSQFAMRRGQRDIGATKVNQILIWDELADSKSLFLTGNSSTIHTWTYTDLANDGPTVIELPPGMLGAVDDMWFRYVTDLGIAGPDQGKGGKYLILPPGYDGEVPEGYFVVRPETYGNWIFMRAYISDGVDKAAQGVKDNLKIYPLSMVDNPPAPEFIPMSGRGDYNAIPPNDYSYWEMLNQLVQEEPIGAHDPETRGLLAALGIAKGQPFAPDDRMKAILTDAVAIGNAYARDYPRYLDGARRAPPEDVGGIPGFDLFLSAIADPDHEQHEDLMRWHGEPFDAAVIDEDCIRTRIAKLARRRALGKAAFAKSRRQIN